MTAYSVPVGMYIYSPDSISLTRIDIEGYNMKALFKTYAEGIYTEELAKAVEEIEKVSGDMYCFHKYKGADFIQNLPYLYWTSIDINVSPKTTVQIPIVVKTKGNVAVVLDIYEQDWQQQYTKKTLKKYSGKRNCTRIGSTNEPWADEICPDPPSHNNTTATGNPVNSFDPNDIFGYLSEAGASSLRILWRG